MIRTIAGVGSLGLVVVVTFMGGGCSSGNGPSGAAPGTSQPGSSSGSVVSGTSSSGSSGSGSGGVGSSSGGSGSSSGSAVGVNLPLVTPLVKAATPAGLDAAGSGHTNAFAGGFHVEDLPVGDGGGVLPGDDGGGVLPGDDGGGVPPGSDMCPGGGGVCPDGGMNVGPGGMNGGPGGDGAIPPPAAVGLDPSDIRSRFFLAGPTNIFSILAALDSRIAEVNQRSSNGNVPCLSATPVPYALTPFGQSVTFYAQCASVLSSPTQASGGFFQFGVNAGIIYLYEDLGAGAIGARLTPAADGSGRYAVQAWMGVGYNNAAACGNANGFDDCSYGVMAIEADAVRTHLELSVAGIGFGYCGAQLVSDGSTVYVQGSIDMGSTCDTAATACVSAADLTATSPCATTSFDLPAIGRAATSGPNGTWAASAYGSDGIVLNGTATDALGFGPSMPTAGVGSFSDGNGDGGPTAPNGDGGPVPPHGDDGGSE